jgi:hypothetical protein
MKLQNYVRLHKALSGLSETSIWELMRENPSSREVPEVLVEVLPDEAYEWARDVAYRIGLIVDATEDRVEIEYQNCIKLPTRKDQALYLASKDPYVKAAVFNKLSGKPYLDILWKSALPVTSKFYMKVNNEDL